MSEKYAALKSGQWHQFSSNDAPKCPHCGEDFDITDNEAWHLYDDQQTHDVECADCGHEFTVNSHARWSFSTDEQEEGEA